MYECKERTFKSFDQTELFYRVWEPKNRSKNVVIILHRGHEHSGRVVKYVGFKKNSILQSTIWEFLQFPLRKK